MGELTTVWALLQMHANVATSSGFTNSDIRNQISNGYSTPLSSSVEHVGLVDGFFFLDLFDLIGGKSAKYEKLTK